VKFRIRSAAWPADCVLSDIVKRKIDPSIDHDDHWSRGIRKNHSRTMGHRHDGRATPMPTSLTARRWIDLKAGLSNQWPTVCVVLPEQTDGPLPSGMGIDNESDQVS
jgi:hypothetical protein